MATRTGTIFVLNFDPRPVPSGDIWIEVPGEYDQITNTRRFKFKVGTGQTAYKYLPYGLIGEEATVPVSSGGDMVGPASSTDNALVRWDGATGKLTQNSVIVVSDLGAITGIVSLNGNTFGPTPGVLIVQGNALTLLSSGAATSGQVATADGAGNISWTTPTAGTGDVVGPAVAVDGHIVLFDGTTGKLIKDGLATSTGGNGAADDGLVAIYGPEGQLHGSAQVGSSYAVRGTATFGAVAGKFTAANATGIEVSSVAGKGGSITTAGDDIGLQVENDSSTTQPALDVTNLGTADIAHFEGPTGGAQVKTDGGIQWSSATGAQTTATALPVFGSGTKGVVPAAGAVPSASKFLDETGVFSVPPDTSGITQLTGDVTAGPGSGSQAATIAADAVTNAKMANMAQATIKGRAAAAGTGDPTDLTADQTSTILDSATDPLLRTSAAVAGYANILKSGNNIDALPLIGTSTTWSNMPAALTWFHGVSTVRPYWPRDLTYYSQARIICLMAATPGFAGSKVRALYYTSADSTISNYLTLGSSEVEAACDVASIATDSGWINLVAGAKADVWIALAGISGNGAADPIFQHIWIMFR